MNPSKESQWRSEDQSLVRTTTNPDGKVVTERIQPDLGNGQLIEEYPDAIRYKLFIPGQEANSPVRYIKAGQVSFIDPKERTKKVAHFNDWLNMQDGTFYSWIEETDLESEPRLSIESSAYIYLRYNKGHLVQCEIQAVPPKHEDLKKSEPELEWRKALPVLINYLQDETLSGLEAFREDYVEMFDFPAATKPLVPEAENLAMQIEDYAVNSLPSENREEAQRLLDLINWRYELTSELLTAVNEQKQAVSVMH